MFGPYLTAQEIQEQVKNIAENINKDIDQFLIFFINTNLGKITTQVFKMYNKVKSSGKQ